MSKRKKPSRKALLLFLENIRSNNGDIETTVSEILELLDKKQASYGVGTMACLQVARIATRRACGGIVEIPVSITDVLVGMLDAVDECIDRGWLAEYVPHEDGPRPEAN